MASTTTLPDPRLAIALSLSVAAGTTVASPPQDSTQRLTRARKRYDLVVFPEETHAMTPAAVGYRTDVMIRHIIRHLAP